MTYVLVGQYCPTDANPDTDIPPDAPWVAFVFDTREEAQDWTGGYWYPNSIIAEVQDWDECGETS